MSEVQNAEPVCPYCGFVFEVMPTRKQKCPQCKEMIYRQSRPPDNIKMLMTESQAAAAKQEWDERDRLREENEFNTHQATLRTSSVHHERRNAYLLLSHYYRKKGPEYFDKAFECQYGMFTEELKGHMGPSYHPGLYFVKIEYGPYTCTHLRPDHTVLYTLEDALAQMPLPHREPASGLCGCWYDLIFNSDDEHRYGATTQGNDSP